MAGKLPTGVAPQLGPDATGVGWGLVRASNTNPYLTLRFEGRSERDIDDMKGVIYDALRRYPFVTLPD